MKWYCFILIGLFLFFPLYSTEHSIPYRGLTIQYIINGHTIGRFYDENLTPDRVYPDMVEVDMEDVSFEVYPASGPDSLYVLTTQIESRLVPLFLSNIHSSLSNGEEWFSVADGTGTLQIISDKKNDILICLEELKKSITSLDGKDLIFDGR